MSGKKEKPVMVITHDWLSELEIGTRFVAASKNIQDEDLKAYEILEKLENSVKLKVSDFYYEGVEIWVDSFRWCQKFLLNDIIPKETKHGHRGTVQSQGYGDHEDV